MFDRHLLEADARRALAGDIVVADRRQPDMTRGQAAEFVRLMGFQHIGLQQGVIQHAAVFDSTQRDVVVGKNMAVVLEVLADDFGHRVFQQRLEPGQRGIAVQLLGCAGVVVRQRHIGGHAGFGGKRDADQFGLHGIEAGGFGVERIGGRGVQFGDPGVECGFGQDGFVVGAMVAAVVLLGGGRTFGGGRIELAQPGAKHITFEQRAQGVQVARLQRQASRVRTAAPHRS